MKVPSVAIARVILYVKDVEGVAAFYQRHFGMLPLPGGSDQWTELKSAAGGSLISLHKASVKQKSGAAMKLVFGVADVRAFKSAREKEGLLFGVVHDVKAEGHEYANAKDPAGNSISISSRGMKRGFGEKKD
jgi:catechol 2,3-dioxygenase-like lactoylglutathione lyase family enzyme